MQILRATTSVAVLAMAAMAFAQYPGQVATSAKGKPVLRAVAVLEYTGAVDKPTASRLVPVMLWNGAEMVDAGVYLARPVPLAVWPQVEYELQQNGQPLGLVDIVNSGQELGMWVGHGSWKPLPTEKPKPDLAAVGKKLVDPEDDDKPVLHRKHHADEDKPAQTDGAPAAPDSDRPVLHKKSDSAEDTNSQPSAGADPDRPVLHKKTEDAATGEPAGGGDPDRPKLKKTKKKEEDVGHAEALDVSDPDRPRIRRGKANGDALEVAPTLMGLPPEMEQTVAVSDETSRPAHPWSYEWANAADAAKMKLAMEDAARQELGLASPPAAAPTSARPASKAGSKTASRRKAAPMPPPEPAPLAHEQYRVFELAYGAGATMVLTAESDGTDGPVRYVTLVGQPDLYGNMQVLFKSTTDRKHLDGKPKMRLVDAVDALADNRGALLFELRGESVRQFALYRVLRGRVDRLFVTGEATFGMNTSE